MRPEGSLLAAGEALPGPGTRSTEATTSSVAARTTSLEASTTWRDARRASFVMDIAFVEPLTTSFERRAVFVEASTRPVGPKDDVNLHEESSYEASTPSMVQGTTSLEGKTSSGGSRDDVLQTRDVVRGSTDVVRRDGTSSTGSRDDDFRSRRVVPQSRAVVDRCRDNGHRCGH